MSPDSGAPSDQPSVVGRYRVVECIACDPISDVYRAFDPMIERPVVVKVFRTHGASAEADREIRQRFFNQMQRTGALVHPGIATLFDAGDAAGALFTASEFVDGIPLSEFLVSASDVELTMRVSLVAQIVDALEYARELGVAHLNLKPTNVLVGDDLTVKLGGFGVASVVDALAEYGVAQPPQTCYTAPERAAGQSGDYRSDVFSLAQLALDILTGGREANASALGPASVPPLPPYLVSRGIDATAWTATMARALATDPARRLSSASALKFDLLLLLGVDESEARLAWETSRAMKHIWSDIPSQGIAPSPSEQAAADTRFEPLVREDVVRTDIVRVDLPRDEPVGSETVLSPSRVPPARPAKPSPLPPPRPAAVATDGEAETMMMPDPDKRTTPKPKP